MRFLILALLATTAFAAPPKKKTPKAPPPKSAAALQTEAEIKKTLDAAEANVGACVLDNAPPGDISLKVKAALMINSAGQLMAATLTMTPEGPANEATKTCIQGVLEKLTWPKAEGPMVNAEREWSFETH